MGDIQLTKKDKAIMAMLDVDARMPLTTIAKKTKLSRNSVEYRIKRLERLKIIDTYFTVIDPMVFGYHVFRLKIRFFQLTPEVEKEIILFCREQPVIKWAAILKGKWDLIILTITKSLQEYHEFYYKFIHRFSNTIFEKRITLTTKEYLLTANYLHEGKDRNEIVKIYEQKNEPFKKDDYRILKELSKDGRMNLITIAQNTNLNINTVRSRIKEMKKSGIIKGFTMQFDTRKLGFQFYRVSLYIMHYSDESLKRIINYLRQNNKVEIILMGIGDVDIEFEIRVKNQEELHNELDIIRFSFPNSIKESHTHFIYNEFIKAKPFLPDVYEQ